MSITLIIGPMFSGKTSELIRLIDRKWIAGKKCLIIKNTKDDRYDNDNNDINHITTHNKIRYQKCDIVYTTDLASQTLSESIKQKNYDIVAIDEGHFFKDLAIFCTTLANDNVDIIVSALDGSYKQELFGEVANLIPHAEIIVKLHAVCMRCKQSDASFTIRTCNSTEQILVGGADIYQSVCRSCLSAFQIS
jgi:thymidine kinase